MAQDKVECNHSGDIDQVQISQLLGSNAKCLVCGFIYPKGGNPERPKPCPKDAKLDGLQRQAGQNTGLRRVKLTDTDSLPSAKPNDTVS